MIQLKVYDTPAKETQHWLDLYDTEPIKLTLSIEDITSTDATSTFSKAFKVPGTRNNAEFFKNSFDVDGVLFDVTVKKPAEILVDGTEFKQGHIRLQKVFLNTEQDRYDYELLFLGETRDFSSRIGDKGLCQLVMPDLVGGIRNPATPLEATPMSALAVSQSWTAYPQAYNPSTGVPYTPSLTQGLHEGNIIYPLMDHGNTYTEAGQSQQTKHAIEPSPSTGNHDWFTNFQHPTTIDRFKPMIRAKRIVDQIFEDAGYTYTSDFFESDLFHQIYISAFGNEPRIGWDSSLGSEDSINVAYGEDLSTAQGLGPLLFENNQIDGGNNLSTGLYINSPWTNNPATFYTISVPGEYRFKASAFWAGFGEDYNQNEYDIRGILQIWNMTTNQLLREGSPANGTGGTSQTGIYVIDTSTTNPSTGNPYINVGDKIALIMDYDFGSIQYDYVTNVRFEVLSAPGEFNPVNMLDCQYKQIDFIKDILTSFRLVLAPNPRDPKDFIVEPWQTYINSGNLHDWSKKLVENKDVQIEPVFFSQSDTIHYSFQPGGDYTNIYNQQAKTHPWGYLPFTSSNDLLKGNRDVKLIGISPTPLVAIENGDYTWSIAQLHTHSSEDAGLQHLPIRPKTRMLFYDGMQSCGPVGDPWYWYFLNSTGNVSEEKWNIYPLMSSYQQWPIVSDTLNLSWQNDIKYFMGSNIDPVYEQDGTTLYDNYWSRYIQSLYGKYSRRVSATFILNNIDLNEFSFDDTIFVNGTYYIPEKIIDVEVGAYTEVKVQLLTANDYRPTINLAILTITDATGVASPCAGGLGSINIIVDGTPGYTWTLSNGMAGSAATNVTPTTPPYSFNIPGIPIGTYILTLTDSLGRTADVSVTIPQSEAAPVTSTNTSILASDCETCDAQITVTPTGGTGPYTIEWNDGNTLFTRTGLCPNVDYSYTVFDSLECSYESTLVNIGCEGPPPTIYKFGRIGADCNTMIAEFKYVALTTTPNISDVWSLASIGGGEIYPHCWSYIGTTGSVADAQLSSAWINCETCQNGLLNQDWYFFTHGTPTVSIPDNGWVPYPDLSPGEPQFAFLTNDPQNYYLGPDGTNQTQSLSDAFTYMLQTAGTPATGTTRWLPIISGFSWNDPSVQSPTVDVANLEAPGIPNSFMQWYVAVKQTLFNQFFTPAVASEYTGPKMWYAYNNQEYQHNGAENSSAYEYVKSFTLNGESYVLLINVVDQSYNLEGITDALVPSYLKFSTAPPEPTSWKVQSCTQPIQQDPLDNSTRFVTINQVTLSPGDVIKTDPADQFGPCYTVIEQVTTEPPNMTFTGVLYDSCQSCSGITPTYNYRIADCITGLSYNMEKGGCTFIVGEVLQYIRNSDTSRIYCGTVIDVSFPTGFEDATIFGCIARDCDDRIHCNIAAPTPTDCTVYELQNGAQADAQYGYTNCAGQFINDYLGGFESILICAQTDSVLHDQIISVTAGATC